MTGGTITGNSTTSGGGGVKVATNGKFYFYGGSIANNSAPDGGGIYSRGTVVMGATSGIYSAYTPTIGGSTASYANTAATNGGGVFIYNGTFTFNKGTISNNSATIGKGVYVSAGKTLTMSGSNALVSSNNDVYVASDTTNGAASVTIAGNLGTSPVATITPPSYPNATTTHVMVLKANTDALLTANYGKFAITPQTGGIKWGISAFTASMATAASISSGGYLMSPALTCSLDGIGHLSFGAPSVSGTSFTIKMMLGALEYQLPANTTVNVQAIKNGNVTWIAANQISISSDRKTFTFIAPGTGNYQFNVTLNIDGTWYSGTFTAIVQ
jgi:predicted outer membrane repeat protein